MNLSNENRLLLYCAQTRIPEYTLNEVKDIMNLPLNWEGVLESALSQGIAPLLCHNLKKLQKSHFIPKKIMHKLERAYYANVARNMYHYEELKRILEAFSGKGVKVIVLKGAALDKSVYGDIGLRTFGDLDLLVKEDDLPYAKKIMSDLEYFFTSGKMSEEWRKKKHFHLMPYIQPDKNIVVEIHWHITGDSFHINIDEWWEMAKVIKIDNCQALILSPEDMLIHLCLHLFNHGYNKITLRGLCDIFGTLTYYRKEINWQRFQDKVDKYKISKPVYTILYFINKHDMDDDNSLRWVKPSLVNLKLLTLIEKRILGEHGVHSDIPKQLVQSMVLDKPSKKAIILLKKIFPTREGMVERYQISSSSKKIYFYYIFRPFYLFFKYGKFILEILRLKKYSIGS
jgi:Uncharacterised nucleotidyltransferase